ncbi:MAG: S-adenosylmethionine:tRNA ribosyltransferase-isomerase [Ferruginibacter sp.]|nr:S-adenosylmethionine:tRNA ribosyltransferase-isomerase [Chitinophagaceae bacterium]
MTDPKHISIKDYTYSLPEERIARYPLAERDASKLIIYREGVIAEDIYKNISHHIPGNSLLVFNNTKVVEARLLFQKPTGGSIEIFCLEPHEQYADITTAMLHREKVLWQCLVGGVSKWKAGQLLQKKINRGDKEIILTAGYIDKRPGSFIIELSWTPPELSFTEVLHAAGAIPLPPYIKRAAEAADADRYQTVYAHCDGSVAAPTAGLHFTSTIFEKFKEKNIQPDYLTLHVGAGTFKPVKSEIIQDHQMHAEWMDVSKKTIENILKNIGNNIIAVGTTSLRTIESLYWLGVKKSGEGRREAGDGRREAGDGSRESGGGRRKTEELLQWEAYELADRNIHVKDALQSLLEWMEINKMDRLVTRTQLLIAPGYSFKIVKGLVTNFHQPQSTLLLLVAAFIGKDWISVYDHALQNDFRFLSYGDGCLLWLNNPSNLTNPSRSFY